jgi:phosphoenolpyruvate synthase/pyruvate phosphate dikinase
MIPNHLYWENSGNFRQAVSRIMLMDGFLEDLEANFQAVFGKKIGNVPVFLRSDTNMEDLKDFTGAGLNLTLFNVVSYETIIQGIKDVWASPYTERSYRWRQQYLLNPENVFPSILIIPSVDVDHSGVMVTKGISSQDEDDLSIAFNRGAGGAVEGQAAESYLLKANGRNMLRAPAREPAYNRLPVSGGTKKYYATFENPMLSRDNISSLRNIAKRIKRQLPSAPGIETNGPFDVELGFRDDELWLFQVRPFVENKNAAASEYLNSLKPEISGSKWINIIESKDIDKDTDK